MGSLYTRNVVSRVEFEITNIEMDQSYFIKKGYVCNPVLTYNADETDEYWTERRIKTSQLFQFHVYELARKIFINNHFKSVIDIGAGPGTKMNFFFNGLADTMVIVDQPTTEPIARQVCPKATFVAGNLDEEDFATGNRYDMVICADVIEHLGNPDNLLQIIRRHMKKDGLAIISTPDRDMRRGKANIQSPNVQHVREWNTKELKKYLEYHDFEVVQHVNLPLKKINKISFSLSKLFYRKIFKADWFACQAVVVR